MTARSVTFLVRSLGVGGAESQLVLLAAGLARAGHRVLVVTFYDRGPLGANLEAAGVPVVALGKRGRWDVFGFYLRLVRALRGERPEVLHPYLPVPNLLALTMRPWLPGVRIVWGIRWGRVRLSRYDWLTRLTFRVSPFLSRFADVLVVNSVGGSAYHQRLGCPADRMVVVQNGIDTERFRPRPEARARIRSEWGIEDGEVLVGLIGRLDPTKDHQTFLEAARRFAAQHDEIRFVCVGGGTPGYSAELRALAQAQGLAGRCVWAGERADMPEVYSALDIATMTSVGEGFPNVVGEAMACGVACAVTDVGDASTIVGETGEVVPVRDAAALAAAWERLLARRPPWPAEALRRRIIEEFGVDRLIARSEEALWGPRR